jgi:hypothetical protein
VRRVFGDCDISKPALMAGHPFAAALVPPLTAYHQSLLSAALSYSPPLLGPQALFASALAPSSASFAPPASLWTSLLPYSALLSLSNVPPAATGRLLDLLDSAETRSPALVDLAARLLATSGLPAAAVGQAASLLAALSAISRPDTHSADLKLSLERAIAQVTAADGGVNLLPSGPVGSSLAVKSGLEERVIGALETDVQSMMKDPSVVAGSEPGADRGQGSRRLVEIVLDALVRRPPIAMPAHLLADLEHDIAAGLARERRSTEFPESGLRPARADLPWWSRRARTNAARSWPRRAGAAHASDALLGDRTGVSSILVQP